MSEGARRWIVEVEQEIQDVVAPYCEVGAGGSLVFTDGHRIVVAYAPGSWLTVSEGGEG